MPLKEIENVAPTLVLRLPVALLWRLTLRERVEGKVAETWSHIGHHQRLLLVSGQSGRAQLWPTQLNSQKIILYSFEIKTHWLFHDFKPNFHDQTEISI